jgi:hypothetical protein
MRSYLHVLYAHLLAQRELLHGILNKLVLCRHAGKLASLCICQLNVDGVCHAACNRCVVTVALAKAQEDVPTKWHAPMQHD